MYLFFDGADEYKAYNIDQVVEHFDIFCIHVDISGMRNQLKKYKCWLYPDGIFAEAQHNASDLKHVPFAPNVEQRTKKQKS